MPSFSFEENKVEDITPISSYSIQFKNNSSIDTVLSNGSAHIQRDSVPTIMRKLMINHTAGNFSVLFTMNALRLHVLESSSDIEELSIVSMQFELPCVVLALCAGSLADSKSFASKTFIGSQWLVLLSGVMLAFLDRIDQIHPFVLYILAFCVATSGVLREPVADRVFYAVCPDVSTWMARFQLCFGICDTLAPILATIVLSTSGLLGVGLCNIFCALLTGFSVYNCQQWLYPSTSLLTTMESGEPNPDDDDDDAAADDDEVEAASFVEFFQWLRHQSSVLTIIGMFLFLNAAYSQVIVVAPVVLRQSHSLAAVGVALTMTSFGLPVGSLVVGATRLAHYIEQKPGLTCILMVILQGLLLIAFTFEPGVIMTSIGGCLFNSLDAPLFSSAAVIINRSTPSNMQGRLSSVRLLFVTIGMPFAQMACAPMTNYLGAGNLFVLLGLLALFFGFVSLLVYSMKSEDVVDIAIPLKTTVKQK